MAIIHVAAECFPVAKVGGLADVVGALPKYQNQKGSKSEVIMPFYNLTFTKENKFKEIFNGAITLKEINYSFKVLKLSKKSDFTIYFIDIPELLYTEYVYSANDTIRFIGFQIAVLKWMITWDNKPEIIHLHDHHTGLIPFMMTQSYQFDVLKNIPTVFTIHNAQYQGWFSYDLIDLIPAFDYSKVGLLDWNGEINPMAAAIKCAWSVTTVSPTYMEELKKNANGLETLLQSESKKCYGILNGIDSEVWNTETDKHLIKNYNTATVVSGKKGNKEWLCKKFGLEKTKPLVVFIGRFVHDKGCDLFAEVFKKHLHELDSSVLILGSGDLKIQEDLTELNEKFKGNYHYVSGYNEPLSHIMYAGADFLLMPSRIEPCGLNQMYSLRYGTIPIVTNVGGLKDTIIDYRIKNGFGIVMNDCTINELYAAIKEALSLYTTKVNLKKIRNKITQIDHSWSVSAEEYNKLYQTLKN
jgi:starch synthase